VLLYTENGRFAFGAPFGSIGATYDDHLRLIGKHIVDFPILVLIELFSLGVTAEALRANIGSKSAISFQRGPVDPKFQVEGDQGVALANHSFCHKTRINGLSCGIRMRAQLSFVSSQITRLTDGQRERILIAWPRLHSMQRGKMSKDDQVGAAACNVLPYCTCTVRITQRLYSSAVYNVRRPQRIRIWTSENMYAWRIAVTVSLTLGNSNYGADRHTVHIRLSAQPLGLRSYTLDRWFDNLCVTRHQVAEPGIGTRRRDRDETETLTSRIPRRWLHQPSRDRDETFVALETWSRR